MKKVFVLLLLGVFTLTLSACFGAQQRDDVVVDVDIDLPSDVPIQLDLFTGFGAGGANTAATQDIIDAFQDLYPNITIIQNPQGNYDQLRDTIIELLRTGGAPALIMGYPDHYAEYAESNAIVPLDPYIESERYGIDLDDYIINFIQENQQFDVQYSMPYMKSTEIIVYNKDIFDAHGITFDASVVTWDDLVEIVENNNIIGTGSNQCEFLLAMGSSSNSFINLVRQWGVGYTNNQGELEFLDDEAGTIAMMTDLAQLYDKKVIVSPPAEWNHNYGSPQFQQGRACMIQSSSAGTGYNLPTGPGAFNVGYLPAIQKNRTLAEGPMSVMQQGPNIAIGADASDVERLAAWLFIKFATNPENSAYLASEANYLPVQYASYETDIWVDYLNTTDRDIIPFAESSVVAMSQEDWFNYDPAFAGRISSSRVRQYVGDAFERLYVNRDPQEVIGYLNRNLGR